MSEYRDRQVVAYVDTEGETLAVYVDGELKETFDNLTGVDPDLISLFEKMGVEVRKSDDFYGDSSQTGDWTPLPTLGAIEQWQLGQSDRDRKALVAQLNELQEKRRRVDHNVIFHQTQLRSVEREIRETEEALRRG